MFQPVECQAPRCMGPKKAEGRGVVRQVVAVAAGPKFASLAVAFVVDRVFVVAGAFHGVFYKALYIYGIAAKHRRRAWRGMLAPRPSLLQSNSERRYAWGRRIFCAPSGLAAACLLCLFLLFKKRS